MRRPALVLLIVLAGAGWGTPALGQGTPTKARAALVGGAATVRPDLPALAEVGGGAVLVRRVTVAR